MPSSSSPLDPASLFSVKGMVAVVTGGGSGIGLMLTKALVAGGAAKVFINGRRLPVLQEAASSVDSGIVVPVQCDVTSKDDLSAAARQIGRDGGGFVNLLVCNSGSPGPNASEVKADTTLEEWAASNWNVGMEDYVQTFAVNTAAVWYTVMAFLGLLDKGNKRGNMEGVTSQVIVTSALSAFNKTTTGAWPYSQSKAAVAAPAKNLSVVLPRWDIRANTFAPGLFPSDMTTHRLERFERQDDGSGGSRINIPKSIIPLGRAGDEQDIAGCVLCLASRAGAYCNGVAIVLDGGRMTALPPPV